jgi:molybdopterin molybdotransferase
MGKFDYVPEVLNSLSVQKLFHKVQQRPGKPFWFGKAREGALVFAFPGNPVSSFLCLYRYFIPWLNASLGLKQEGQIYASLGQDFDFSASLTYFLQVQLKINEEGQLVALPLEGHGSGDFANLANSQAFMELPSGVNHFKKGERYRIWSYKPII